MLLTSNDVCSAISDWWTNGRRNDIFSMSGDVMVSVGYGGGALVREWNAIIVPRLDILDLMYTDTKTWRKWIKCVEQSNKLIKEPIMFFIHRNKYIYMVMSNKYVTRLEEYFGNRNNMLLLKGGGVCIMSFAGFVDWSLNIKLMFKNDKRKQEI